ncbi:MAG: hypothetical protein ACREFN_10615, partial [Acetobacteraceae bacterium]
IQLSDIDRHRDAAPCYGWSMAASGLGNVTPAGQSAGIFADRPGVGKFPRANARDFPWAEGVRGRLSR